MTDYQRNDNELIHYGVLGMKWGHHKAKVTATKPNNNSKSNTKKSHSKTVIKVGATVAGTALVTYGSIKLSKYLKSEAGKKSCKTGQKIVDDYFKQTVEPSIMSPINKADHYYKMAKYMQMSRNVDSRTENVQKSTMNAVKYLMHPEKYDIDF